MSPPRLPEPTIPPTTNIATWHSTSTETYSVFTHLHTHSHFSFGFGASSPAALIDAAIARGFRTMACTDTNGVYGAVEFQQAAESAGIRPILGAHLRLEGQEAVALATDDKGWGALCRAITRIHWGKETRRTSPLSTMHGEGDRG